MLSTYQYGDHSINCIRADTAIEDQVQTKIFFRAKEVAANLGYQNTKKAIQDHVAAKYKMSYRDLIAPTGPISGQPNKLDGFDLNAIYLTEA